MWLLSPVTAAFLFVDLAFFFANMAKVVHGGWVALLVAALVITIMRTWKKGLDLVAGRMQRDALPIETFVESVARHPTQRVPGTAVFLVSDPAGTPTALLHNIKHNRVLHSQNVILTVLTEEVPHVPPAHRLETALLGPGFSRVIVRYGFMQDPDVMTALGSVERSTLGFDPQQATYFLSRNTLLSTRGSGMALWRERLFIFLSRNALRPSQFFQLPPNRIVELGMRVEL